MFYSSDSLKNLFLEFMPAMRAATDINCHETSTPLISAPAIGPVPNPSLGSVSVSLAVAAVVPRTSNTASNPQFRETSVVSNSITHAVAASGDVMLFD